jgi:hypothetical protein
MNPNKKGKTSPVDFHRRPRISSGLIRCAYHTRIPDKTPYTRGNRRKKVIIPKAAAAKNRKVLVLQARASRLKKDVDNGCRNLPNPIISPNCNRTKNIGGFRYMYLGHRLYDILSITTRIIRNIVREYKS